MINSAEEYVELRSSTDPDQYRRAAHDEAPTDVWLDVISRFPDYRFWVAQNKTVPLEVLARLAKDPDPGVRSMVSMKRKLTADILELMASDPHDPVRLSVAGHRATPRHVLERLLDDPWVDVRDQARERLDR
jgi:hypothetical protein